MLVHMTPGEVQALQGIASAAGGSLTLNPSTGLPEAGFLKELLPTIAGGLLKSVFPGMGELGIGLLTAGVSGLLEGDLKKGLTAGMEAYGGAKIASGISQLGKQEAIRQAKLGQALTKTAEVGRKEFGLEPVDLSRAASATTMADLGIVPTKTPFVRPSQLQAPGTFGLRPASDRLERINLSDLAKDISEEAARSQATPKRGTLSEYNLGLKALFTGQGGRDFISSLGGPEKAGLTMAPILGALQRAERESAQRKFARSQPPNYYYVPGAFDFESGTFAPGGYYTGPGQPYTPKTGFAEGGVVFQEGGEATSTQPLQQYYQGLLTPPDTSMGEARRAETLDYINWLNNFLKQRPAGDTGLAPPGSGGNIIVGGGGGDFVPPSGGAPVGGMPPTTRPVVTKEPVEGSYTPPLQVPIEDIWTPPYPEIQLPEPATPEYDVIASDLADLLNVSEPYVPETLTEDQYKDFQDSLVAPVINYPVVETPEPATPEYDVIASDLADLLNVSEPYVPETLTEDQYQDLQDSLVAPVINYPSDLANVLDVSEPYVPETLPMSEYSDLMESLTPPVINYLQDSNMVFTEPSREQVTDLLKQSPAPEINFGDKESSWRDLASKIGREAARALVASQFGVLGALAFDKLFKEEPPAEEPAAEEATGAGGGDEGGGDYFSTFGRDPYSSIYRDIVYGGGGGGRGAITVTEENDEVEEKTPEGNASGGIISGYNQDLGMANIAPNDPLSFMNPRPVRIPPASRGLGTEDLRMMRRSAAAGPDYNFGFAKGGIIPTNQYAAGGKLLNGPGDGMSDDIKANIDGQQEARLADGEFVIPADVVSHLGNGSTKAGARKLYAMMDRVRKARTGSTKQGREINPNKFIPA